MQSVGEYQGVPKVEDTVMPVRGLRKRRRDRNLASGRRQKPKGRIQASCDSQKRLAVACRKMTRHARVAWRKRNIARKYCTRAIVVQEIRRGRTFGKRHQPKPECSKGIWSRDVVEQPRLEIMGNNNEVFGRTIGLEFGKRAARSSVASRKIKNWTLWKGGPLRRG
jgi:hypothetical protein